MSHRTPWLIASMAILIVMLAAALGVLLSRGPADRPSAGTASTAGPASPPPVAAAPREDLAARAPADDSGLRQWIVGGWAELSTNCETDTGEHFNADGRFANFDQQGYWRIDSGRLTVRVTHELPESDEELSEDWARRAEPSVTTSTLTRKSDDRRVTVSNGERIEMMRCPLSNYTFTIPAKG
jgi:hypothetical protein